MQRILLRTFLPATLLILLFLAPQAAIEGAHSGFLLWANTVLPALLPFYVITQLLQQCGGFVLFSTPLRPVCRLLRLPDDFGGLLLAGWLSGAPNGARLLAPVSHDKAVCTRTCACFTVTGPLFLIGTAGQLLNSTSLGALIYAIHLLTAICNGYLWRKYGTGHIPANTAQVSPAPQSVLSALPEALRSSGLSLLFIGSAIAFFSSLTSILHALGWVSALEAVLSTVLPADTVSALVAGFFEVSQGTLLVCRGRISLPLQLSLLCAFASFGGLSVLCQAKVFLAERIRTSVYFLQRLTHAALSFCLCRLLCFLFTGSLPVFVQQASVPVSITHRAAWLAPVLCLVFSLIPRKTKGR